MAVTFAEKIDFLMNITRTSNSALAGRMALVLSQENRIKIIHIISRDLDEMLNAISQWMPLYMSGAIEPYFYPKKRDGIFKRTLFIAPELAAVVSSSVGDQVAAAANILYRDVTSFAQEFLHYLRLCRPLMRIFTNREREECYAALAEFEQEQADALIRTESLSLLTMPGSLLASITGRSGIDTSDHLSVQAARHARFLESLRSNQFTELIHLPDMETLESGGVKVSMSDMLDGGAVFYTPTEYAAHLEQVIALITSFENYRAVLIDRLAEGRYMVYAWEEQGVIVAKTSKPPVVMAMSEGNMTAAFWDFLKGMVDEKTYKIRGSAGSLPAKPLIYCLRPVGLRLSAAEPEALVFKSVADLLQMLMVPGFHGDV